jgi:hypothetical protein
MKHSDSRWRFETQYLSHDKTTLGASPTPKWALAQHTAKKENQPSLEDIVPHRTEVVAASGIVSWTARMSVLVKPMQKKRRHWRSLSLIALVCDGRCPPTAKKALNQPDGIVHIEQKFVAASSAAG